MKLARINISLGLVLFATSAIAQSSSRIINGTDVKRKVPYMTALYAGRPSTRTFFCGGTLVKPGWVLTAAHCAEGMVYGDVTFRVGVGGTKLSNPKSVSKIQAIFFDRWNPNTFQRDWALLKLARKIRAKQYPILADQNRTGIHKAFGWGSLDPFVGVYPNFLQTAKIPIWNQDRCSSVLGSAFDSKTMICGSKLSSTIELLDGVDTCYGDSGGPVTSIAGRVQYGITSWGYDCASSTTPGVYGSVPAAKPWVLDTIKKFS